MIRSRIPIYKQRAYLLFSKWFDIIRTGRHFIVVVVTETPTQHHLIITAYTARKLSRDNPK